PSRSSATSSVSRSKKSGPSTRRTAATIGKTTWPPDPRLRARGRRAGGPGTAHASGPRGEGGRVCLPDGRGPYPIRTDVPGARPCKGLWSPRSRPLPFRPMKIAFLGTGSAFSLERYNGAVVVDGRLLLDGGAPLLPHMHRLGIDPGGIEALFLTHFHG